MEKKTISAGIIGAGGFIGQEHLKRLTKQIDGAVVTAWDSVHAEVTSKAIVAGKPVFCEKPLTTTKADCAEIVRNEQAAGRNLVQVGCMRRYGPDYCKIKAILDSGELGKPHAAHRSRIYQRHAGDQRAHPRD